MITALQVVLRRGLRRSEGVLQVFSMMSEPQEVTQTVSIIRMGTIKDQLRGKERLYETEGTQQELKQRGVQTQFVRTSHRHRAGSSRLNVAGSRLSDCSVPFMVSDTF